MNAVAREFEYRGWKITKTPEDLASEGNDQAVLVIQKGAFYAHVPPAEFMRMHMEALRPQTVISTYEAKFREGPSGDSGFSLALYEGEGELWN